MGWLRNYSRVLHILINSDDELKNRILTRYDCHKRTIIKFLSDGLITNIKKN